MNRLCYGVSKDAPWSGDKTMTARFFEKEGDMFKTGLIIGAHLEELSFGEKTVKGLSKTGIETIRIDRGISNEGNRNQPKSRRMSGLHHLYYGIDERVRNRFDLVLDLHYGFSAEAWGTDIFSSKAGFLDFLDTELDRTFPKRVHSPENVRLFKIIQNEGSKAPVFDDRFPVCLSFLPESIVNNEYYHYVGLEFYLTSKKGSRADHRLSRRMILGIHECAGRCLCRKA